MASPALLINDLLSDIFHRLPEPADLVRTVVACVPFLDRAFLCRFRSLHPAPLLGFLDHNGFHPVLSPHASTPVAWAVSLAWVVRDGRVLRDILV